MGILGDVYHNRTGSPGGGNKEGFGHHLRYIFSPGYLDVPFGNGHGESHDIRFLESIRTQEFGCHLPAYTNDGSGVQHGICQSRCKIRCSWSRGHHTNTHSTRYPGITLGGMGCTLLMPGQDMCDLILVVIQEVINGHNGSARIPEYGINPFLKERQNNGFRSAYLFCFHMLEIINI